MIIEVINRAFWNVVTATCLAFIGTFVFLAYFKPETLDRYVPLASAHIHEAVDIISTFITSLF